VAAYDLIFTLSQFCGSGRTLTHDPPLQDCVFPKYWTIGDDTLSIDVIVEQ
jgi:hypothetical protein